MSGPADDDRARPLLPGLAGHPGLARQLRLSLETLREHADPRTRDRLTAVLEGRAALRDVAREPGFGAFVGPLADQGWARFEQLDEDEREAARTAVERDEGRPDAGRPPHAGSPPAHDGGTW